MRLAIVATGASGVVYAARLAEVAAQHPKLEVVGAVVTRHAELVARHELPGGTLRGRLEELGIPVYGEEDWHSPLASGGSAPDAVVVAPCSCRMLAAVANGLHSDLAARVALNALRMGRRLVLLLRETPLGVAELRNALKAAEAGAIVMPAAPAFYHKPVSVGDLVDYIVGRVLDVLGVEHDLYRRWGS